MNERAAGGARLTEERLAVETTSRLPNNPPAAQDGLETHGAGIRPIICLMNLLLSVAALRGRSQVGPA